MQDLYHQQYGHTGVEMMTPTEPSSEPGGGPSGAARLSSAMLFRLGPSQETIFNIFEMKPISIIGFFLLLQFIADLVGWSLGCLLGGLVSWLTSWLVGGCCCSGGSSSSCCGHGAFAFSSRAVEEETMRSGLYQHPPTTL